MKHPLCLALVRRKWKMYGRTIYYFELLLYLIFLAFFTTFSIYTSEPYVKKYIELGSESEAELTICNATGINGVEESLRVFGIQGSLYFKECRKLSRDP